MPRAPHLHRFLPLALLLTVQLSARPALAQPGATAAATPRFELQAHTPTGLRFTAAQLRGKVSLVFFWSTDCAVCRDSLPELRANQRGWQDRPFALLTVNLDRHAQDWLRYEQIAAQMRRDPTSGWLAVRADAAAFQPARLPLTLVLDAQGRIVARYEGRMAPEAWDAVAELLL